MGDITTQQVEAGQAMYTRPFLRIYDRFALGMNCRLLWHSSARRLLDFYNQHVSANHLDAGAGTGYFPDRCRFPSETPRLAILDLNPNCLKMSAKRLARYNPEVYRRNVLDPIEIDGPNFDSIGIFNVLHCLPGTIETKGVVFDHLKALLNPGGVVFGSTLLYGGVRRSPLAMFAFSMSNRAGVMTNKQDDLEGLERSLEQHFPESSVTVIGCEALFRAN